LEATFFVASPADATGVTCIDDLPVDPAGESIRIGGVAWIRALGPLLGLVDRLALEPIRDATCQSFPVFGLGADAASRIAGLGDERLDEVAGEWLETTPVGEHDFDLHELSELLRALREALSACSGVDEGLYVLLEEKAL
jgi:hypothetical protein